MTHPNTLALDYICEKFTESYFSEKTKSINHQVKKFRQAIKHKAFYPQLEQHQQFLKKLKDDLTQFQENTQLDFSLEIESVQQQIIQ